MNLREILGTPGGTNTGLLTYILWISCCLLKKSRLKRASLPRHRPGVPARGFQKLCRTFSYVARKDYIQKFLLARKDYIQKFLFSELISRRITFQLQEIFSGNSFPENHISLIRCDSENYIEKLFGKCFLQKSHFSHEIMLSELISQ